MISRRSCSRWAVAALVFALHSPTAAPPAPDPHGVKLPIAPSVRRSIAYPEARRGSVVDDYYGVRVADPYRWLEDLDALETRSWIEAQNRVTSDFLAQIGERGHIEQRLRELYGFERYGVPEKRGSRYFYSRNEGLQNQPVIFVEEAPGGAPRVLFDANALSPDGTVAIAFTSPSPDGALLAYGLATAGSDWVEVRVRDVATGRDLPDRLEWTKFTRVAWTSDRRGFFYSRFPEPTKDAPRGAPTYFNKLYHHRLGAPVAKDALVYERPDHKEWMFDGEVTDDGQHLVVTVSKSTDEKNLVLVGDLSRGLPERVTLTEIVSTFEAEYELVGGEASRLWFRTNRGAPRGRIVAIDLLRPSEPKWAEIVRESTEALERASWVDDRLVLTYLKDARNEVRVHDKSGRFQHGAELPGLGTVRGLEGRQRDKETFFSFASFTTPAEIFRYEPRTNKSSVFRTPQLPFDPSRYETRQVFVASRDGARVPLFITHRVGLVPDGQTPTFLYGYGGFNIAITPAFDPALLEWVEMGGIYAVASLRGGGEYGKEWHEAGMKLGKQTVFDDFIATARWLVASGLTRVDRLAIGGRSNGGLLVGACLTQHPELFGAALPAVGVMDMLRYHRYTIGWAWADEYGTVDDPTEFRALLAYSPLHAIRPGTRYPATLVTTADHDDRVVPAHSFKFAAALQAAQSGDAPVLIRVETRAGHGAGTPTAKLIEEQADRWAFLVRALGFTPWAGEPRAPMGHLPGPDPVGSHQVP